MEITLENIGTRFNRDWIFRNLSYTFSPENPTAILGANGSGKSTLLRVISGSAAPSEGKITYTKKNGLIDVDNIHRYLSYASPYLELIEEFTFSELIDYQFRLKPLMKKLQKADVLELSELSQAKNKAIRYYSSGMKQRVKLTLAILSDTPILLLDEPSSNLDKNAVEWYQQLIKNYTNDRTIIVCSNHTKEEYFFCTNELIMEEYK